LATYLNLEVVYEPVGGKLVLVAAEWFVPLSPDAKPRQPASRASFAGASTKGDVRASLGERLPNETRQNPTRSKLKAATNVITAALP
jgi:hypothetical protein